MLSVGESGNRLLELEDRMKQALTGDGIEELDEAIRLLQPDLMYLEQAGSHIREIEAEKDFQRAAPIPETQKLSEDLARLRKINRRNLMILQTRLGVIRRLMSFAGAADGPATYQGDGGIQTARGRD